MLRFQYSTSPALAIKRSYTPRLDHTAQPRRQTLTAKETRTLDEMFASVFSAASRQEEVHGPPMQDSQWAHNEASTSWSAKPMEVRWARAGDAIFDMKKEEIELCDNDQALYEWTVDELFGSLTSTPSVSTQEDTANDTRIPAFAYPQLLATVMKTFRIRYQDPHTALALFDYARHASPTSYVTCCGTATYNELIETKWESFRDLQGVCEAIEEMKLNQVNIDTRTTRLVENLRREVGERHLWREEGFGESQETVMNLVGRIERCCWPEEEPRSKVPTYTARRHMSSKWKIDTESWKRPSRGDEDRLEFV